jgi:membrane protein DedA with SNARE-associated domain
MFEFLSSGFNELLVFVDKTDPVYIYLILFGMAFVENVFPPLPGDTFTIIGGYLVSVGKLSLAMTLTSVSLGTILSVMAIYSLAYRGGRGFLVRRRMRFFNAYDIRRVQGWFNRFGAWTLLFSRFVIGGRVAIAIGAGLSKYPTVRMTLFSMISTVVFHGTLIALAFLMHAYISSLVEGFGLFSKIVLALVAALVILWIILLVRRFRNGKEKA